MHKCRKCGDSFPSKIKKKDGKVKYLHKRTLCPSCSDAHQTKVKCTIAQRAKETNTPGKDGRINGIPSELEFSRLCVERGFAISIPFGDRCQYDVVVDTGTKLYRVQVKSSNEGGFRFTGGVPTNGFDILACHIKKDNIWAFIPNISVMGYRNVNVSRSGHWAQFIEQWDRFK